MTVEDKPPGGTRKARVRWATDMPLLYIEWDDHYSNPGWQDKEEIPKVPAKCKSVGWLFSEDEHGIVLFGSVSDGETYSDTRFIMKRCVTKRVIVRKGAGSKDAK